LLIGTFDDYFYIMRFYIYSGVCYVDYWYLFPVVFESFPLRILVSAKKVEISESCPARDRAGRRTMGSIIS
jgi:hypothetical protein